MPEGDAQGAVLAAVDIGSHAVRLLVAQRINGAIVPLRRELIATRLGERMADGILGEAAQRRTLAALADLAAVLRPYAPRAVTAVATSAVREARNGRDFARAAGVVLRVPVRVLRGDEEARLSYLGAVRGLGLAEAVVVDIGGGSTELVYSRGETLVARSWPVGAMRPADASRAAVEQALRNVSAGVPPSLPLVGVGGTVTTLVAVEKRLVPYDPQKVHGTVLAAAAVDRLFAYLAGLGLVERRQVPGLQPERADIILNGIVILQVVLAQLGRSALTVSEADLLDGLLWEMNV